MDTKQVRRELAVVKRPAAQRRRQQRDDLLAQALKKDDAPAIGLLLDLIEVEADGGALRINPRLQHIVDLDPTALANAVALVSGARR
jgi:hypothetical protein